MKTLLPLLTALSLTAGAFGQLSNCNVSVGFSNSTPVSVILTSSAPFSVTNQVPVYTNVVINSSSNVVVMTTSNIVTVGMSNLVVSCGSIISNTITLATSPTNVIGALLIGAGSYPNGASVTVQALGAQNWQFVNWTENGVTVSTSANYTFTLTANRSLVAWFSAIAPPPASSLLTFGQAGSTTVLRWIATDSAGNNIVAGYFFNAATFGTNAFTSAGLSDMILAKLSPTGQVLWAKKFGGTNYEEPKGVTVDSGGNIILIASVSSASIDFGGGALTGSNTAICVAKFNTNGDYLWAHRYGSVYDNVPYSVATDSAGNVLVTGYYRGTVDFGGVTLNSPASGNDTFLLKLSAAGVLQWVKQFPSTSANIGYGVAVETNGNIALGGVFLGAINLQGFPVMVATNIGGNTTFVLGPGSVAVRGDGSSTDIYLAKFNSSGGCLTNKSYGNAGADTISAGCLKLDSAGNIIVAGTTQPPTDFGCGPVTNLFLTTCSYLLKTDPTGNCLFSRRFGGSNGKSTVTDVAVDSNGNIYPTGYFTFNVDFGGGLLASYGGTIASIFAVKYSPTGMCQWADRYGGASGSQGGGISAAGAGVVMDGYFAGSVTFGSTNVVSAGGTDSYLYQRTK